MNNLGHAVNADVVVENFDVIYHAVSQIGTRVSVKTCEVPVQSLYDYMEIPIRSDLVACETLRVLMGLLTACLGEVVKVQGWQLRRCLSHVNRICGRPYGPKGEKLRTICAQMGSLGQREWRKKKMMEWRRRQKVRRRLRMKKPKMKKSKMKNSKMKKAWELQCLCFVFFSR